MRAYGVAALLLALVLAGCSSGDGDAEPTPSSGSSRSADGSGSATHTTGGSTGGDSGPPTPVEAGTDLLDWTKAPGKVTDTTTVAGDWTLTVTEEADKATLDGPDGAMSIPAGRNGLITDALIDGAWAVVVVSDTFEEHPATATVVDLDSGDTFTLDSDSDVPTTNGGTWALGDGRALHATIGPDRAYCLASVDLAAQTSEIAWCAPERNGFSNARISVGGDSMMTFDDSRPSCRRVVSVADGDVTEFPGVTECKGWDGVLLGASRVWSIVPKGSQVEAARLYASIGDRFFDLGPGKSGTLVACGDAAYFTRDPQTDRGPAELLRWTDDGTLSVVYQSPKAGGAFIAGPARCGGDELTLTALTSSGDEQVTAATS
ncbi:MAG: hypothetical protein U0R80_01555 [Nocardioidaceae bacterium]